MTFFGLTAAYAQCNHTLTMIDSWGDGWNGATVDLTVNGATVLSAVSCSGSSTDASFTAATGDAIALANWVSGSYDNEISWELKDGTGALISSGVWGDVTGGSGLCANCPEPTALTATNVTSSSADISWTAGGTETEWWLVVNGSGQSVTSTTNSLTTLSSSIPSKIKVGE